MPRSVQDTPHREMLDEITYGLTQASILRAAIELEVFSHIAKGHCSVPALCRQTSSTERGMRVLLDALMAIGLIHRQLTEYALASTAQVFLIKGQPSYIGDAILTDFAWDARGQLSQTIRGKRIEPTLRKATQGDFVASQIVDWQKQAQSADTLWGKLGFTKAKIKNLRVLDVGCGAGILAFALAQRHSSVRVTAVDQAQILPHTKQIAKAMGVASQVKTIAGDVLTVKFKTGLFDLVLFDNVTTYISVEQCVDIFHRAFNTLVTNGWMVIRAPLPDENRKTDLSRSFAGIETLLFSAAGDTHSFAEYRGMLEIAGFLQVVNHKDEWGLITARKIVTTRDQRGK